MSEELTPRSVDLFSEDQDWVEMTIPGSDRPVRLARLYLDTETKATVSLVEFPQGWQRPESGSYAVAEEFVVLRGAITISGVAHKKDDYVLLPAHTARTTSATPDGCLALAAFSGPPRWVPGAPTAIPVSETVHCPADQAVRGSGTDFQGSLKSVEAAPSVSETTMDLLDLRTGAWTLVLPGGSAPELGNRTLVRWW